MKKILRRIVMFWFSGYHRKKQKVDVARTRKRTIIIAPVGSTYFKLAGVSDDRESSRIDA